VFLLIFTGGYNQVLLSLLGLNYAVDYKLLYDCVINEFRLVRFLVAIVLRPFLPFSKWEKSKVIRLHLAGDRIHGSGVGLREYNIAGVGPKSPSVGTYCKS
jgi:hypothetical protein